MAVQLFAYAQSKGYDIKLYADTTAVSYNPFEFTVADWKVTYDARDAYEPGIISSRMEMVAPITQGEYSQNLETILQDGDGIFYMTLSKNLGDLWKGYCTPGACTIEVINGQRFVTIAAGDGFHLLNTSSDGYNFTGRKAFTTQIADIFNRLELFRLFNGFLVSKDLTRVYNSSASYDSLFLTGTSHLGLYSSGTSFRKFKDVLEDICVAFSLQMYQDKGYIIFRDFTNPESSFNVYNTDGSYNTNVDFSSSQTMDVISGGTKMYLPPVRNLDIKFQYENSEFSDVRDQFGFVRHWITVVNTSGVVIKTRKDWVDLGTLWCDGAGHLDYDMDVRVLYEIPSGTPNSTLIWEVRLYFFLSDYTTDGSTWTNASRQYVRYTVNQNITGVTDPTLAYFTHTINNAHLPTLPSIGQVNVGFALEIVQTSGPEMQVFDPEAKWNIYQHGGTNPYRGYRADNSRRRLGVDLSYNTNFGDLPNYFAGDPVEQQIVYLGPSQTAKTWPTTWIETQPDGTTAFNSLLQTTANRTAQRRGVPVEYFELDLHQTSTVTHTGSWGGVDYFPVNIEYSHNGSRVTYARIVNYALEPDPLRYDTEL